MKVTLIAAQSVDGFITQHDLPGSDFTSAEDKEHFLKSLRDFDCQIMGAETFRVWQRSSTEPVRPKRPQWVLTRHSEAFTNAALPGWLEFTNEAPSPLLEKLASRGLQNCALLGGSQIHRLFLTANCVDELWLTVEPVLFGRGTPLVGSEMSVAMKLISHTHLSANTLLLKYSVR